MDVVDAISRVKSLKLLKLTTFDEREGVLNLRGLGGCNKLERLLIMPSQKRGKSGRSWFEEISELESLEALVLGL